LENETLQFIEKARDKEPHSGFIAEIFLGKANLGLLDFSPVISSPGLVVDAQPILDEFRRILRDEVDPNEIDRAGNMPSELIEKLCKLGVLNLKNPREFGGPGFDQNYFKEAIVTAGSYCGNTCALISPPNSIGALEPILNFGTDEQKKRILPELARGKISAFALTERGAGSDPSLVITNATRVYKNGRHVGYKLNGSKLYTTCSIKDDGVTLADYIVVVARTYDDPIVVGKKKKLGFGLYLVQTDSEGFRAGLRCHFAGLRAICNGETHYHDVFVPLENRIGKEGDGFKIAFKALEKGRISISAICMGTQKQTLQHARWWAKERKQWRKYLYQHELSAERLVKIASRTFVTNAMVNYFCSLVDRGGDYRLASAICKIIASEYNLESIFDTYFLRGGRGYETYFSLKRRGEAAIPTERMLRDGLPNLIFEGENNMLRLYVGREGLNEYISRGLALMGYFYSFLTLLGIEMKGWKLKRTESLEETVRKLPKNIMGIITSTPKVISAIIWILLKLIPTLRPSLPFSFLSHKGFIKKETRVLKRHIIANCMKYGAGLERKQIVVKRIVGRAMDYFLMAVALKEAEAKKEFPLAKELADYFCEGIRREHMKEENSLRWNLFGEHNMVLPLAKRIVAGEAAWLEEGIISTLEKEGVKI